MIDREKVIKEYEDFVKSFSKRDDTYYKSLFNSVLALLKEQEAKHGEWIDIWREDDPDTSSHARCSVCNRISTRPVGAYCKWCGAKMDDEVEGR